ncbi:peroxiredoxin [Candidatus Peregrinibacteria bacterium]|jgi:peroxiredoxin 2/4|nr:peroxiredoxin [Candidatus Peregrinibacteria bacterium]MBT4632290.1 peroxiredoxin [Candidatus Peregrinibacteria bacterium]MBT5516874.1 peroxiredoxin [Candidatus Peregrinibacteria bacterium]MBT5824299.1 peroxiredoxin [Candidatus Peregrinibacteria bacterium]
MGCCNNDQDLAQVAKMAPDFTAEGVFGEEFKKVSLSDYRGKWVVLFFYPLDFTFICPTEITAFNDAYEKFQGMNTEVLSVSTDSVHSHLAWKKNGLGEMKFGMLADMTHEISWKYGVLLEEEGISTRGVFVIDPEGVLKISIVHDNSIGRNVDEVIRVVKAAQTGELCPVNWNPGGETLGKA